MQNRISQGRYAFHEVLGGAPPNLRKGDIAKYVKYMVESAHKSKSWNNKDNECQNSIAIS